MDFDTRLFNVDSMENLALECERIRLSAKSLNLELFAGDVSDFKAFEEDIVEASSEELVWENVRIALNRINSIEEFK